MKSKLVTAVVKSGLIPEDLIAQMQKWGMHVDVVDEKDIIHDPIKVAEMIEEALTELDLVEVRSTDLDILREFLISNQAGTLVLKHPDTGEKASFSITYCQVRGEYIIPWKSESISEMLTAEGSYLRAEGFRIYFNDIRELFFGNQKAFVACSSDRWEATSGGKG